MGKPASRRFATLAAVVGVVAVALLGVWAVRRAVHDSTEPLEDIERLERRIEASMPRGPGGAARSAAAPAAADAITVVVTPTEQGSEIRIGGRRWVLPRAEPDREPVLALVRAEVARAADALTAKGHRVMARLEAPGGSGGLLREDVMAVMGAIVGAGLRDVELAPTLPGPAEAPAPAGR